MRILGCLDGTNAEQVAKATSMLSADETLTLGLVYVIDTGPRRRMGLLRERFFRPRAQPLPHEAEMLDSEKSSARDILAAGLRYLTLAGPIEREGRPGHEIVNVAALWRADVVVICARTQYGEEASIGPKSVGHVARFVLDHAPCPIMLIRPLAREQFPINR